MKKILNKVSAELLEDETLDPGYIEPFKSQGIQSVEESAIIVRGRCMAEPGEQLMIRNAVYLRIQATYKGADAGIARRQVAVDQLHGIDLGNEQAEAIGDAAAAVIAQEEHSPA